MNEQVEEFIDDFLQHEYDPVKAREYYLRTRKLKGRAGKALRKFTKTKVEDQGSVSAFVRKGGVKENGRLVFENQNRRFRPDKQTSRFVSDAKDARDGARSDRDAKVRGNNAQAGNRARTLASRSDRAPSLASFVIRDKPRGLSYQDENAYSDSRKRDDRFL